MNADKDNKAVFSVLTVDHPGVLLRVTGLFSRRGFNIDSIVACKTQTPGLSRWTLVVAGDEAAFTQLQRQLLKMEDVVKVEVLEAASCSCSELLLIKLKADADGRNAVLREAQTHGGRVLDIGDTTITLELTGRPEQIDQFLEKLDGFGIVEMARTGLTAMERGDATIHNED